MWPFKKITPACESCLSKDETIELLNLRVKQLLEEKEGLKEYRLKYRIAKMYADDDEAILELLEVAKKNEARQSVDAIYAQRFSGAMGERAAGQAARHQYNALQELGQSGLYLGSLSSVSLF